jgi:hypothetical protein
VKSKLRKKINEENAYYQTVHNLLSPVTLCKKVKVKIYKLVILRDVWYVCDICLSQSAEKNIWTEEGWSDWKVEKMP